MPFGNGTFIAFAVQVITFFQIVWSKKVRYT